MAKWTQLPILFSCPHCTPILFIHPIMFKTFRSFLYVATNLKMNFAYVTSLLTTNSHHVPTPRSHLDLPASAPTPTPSEPLVHPVLCIIMLQEVVDNWRKASASSHIPLKTPADTLFFDQGLSNSFERPTLKTAQ